MRLPVPLLVLSLLVSLQATADSLVGFRRLTVPEGPRGRALDTALWYPARPGGTPERVGDNPAFVGIAVAAGAPPEPGRHPLVLLSHGYAGNWSNEGWLAADLARQGYLVAAPNHPGTTSRDLWPVTLGLFLSRPRDLSRLLDHLVGDPTWSPRVDPGRVAAIGHSLGGWTVMELVGAQIDPGRLRADCRDHPHLVACRIASGADLAPTPDGPDRLDPRIRAVVTLDIGLARGFDPASLARIARPVLVLAAGTDLIGLPAALESEAMVSRLPVATTRSMTVPGAAHFSFLPLCKPGAREQLERACPGEGVIAQDGPGADRAQLHLLFASEISRFLAASLLR